LQQQGKRHNGYLSVVCINNDNKGRTENECSPCERPEKDKNKLFYDVKND
jgi:hypothetical protein